MKLAYPAIFETDENAVSVSFPDLDGCFTFGDDFAEAMVMAQEAAGGWLLVQLEDGLPFPKPSAMQDIVCKNGLVNMVAVNMDEVIEKYGKHPVKKTLTIPAWMNAFAEEHNISCSKLLQDAISKLMQSEAYTCSTDKHRISNESGARYE